MISTKEIELTKYQYFKILARIRFTQSWYVYLLPFLAALAIYFLMPESEWLVKFLIVYGIINPTWILIYLTIHVNSNKAEGITIARYYSIDNQKITAKHRDGSSDEFLIDNIIEVKQFKAFYLLYFSKSEFIYLPFTAFENENIKDFISILKKESKII
ncbi:MAG: YcxB family protein [Bacteroidia bacterium]